MIIHRPPAVLALLLALTLAACGDDDASPSPTGSPTAAPSATAGASPTASASLEQLSYIGPDADIRIVDADGLGDRTLAAAPCDAGDRVRDFSMAWSPDGAALGFVCGSDLSPELTLVVLNSDGSESARVPGVSRFRWSPDGGRIAYQTSTEQNAFVVGLLDAGTGATEVLNDDAVLMEWAGTGSLLLGLEPVPGDLATEFKAHRVDLTSGASIAYPEFDNAGMLWVRPDGEKVIVLTDQRDPDGGGPGMAVYDLAQDLAVVIAGGYIGYPSEFIPHGQLAFSRGGASIYWVNAAGAPAPVWTATLDEGVAHRVGEVDSLFVAVSPSGRVAALNPGQNNEPGSVAIVDLVAGTRAEVDGVRPPFAWRTVAGE